MGEHVEELVTWLVRTSSLRDLPTESVGTLGMPLADLPRVTTVAGMPGVGKTRWLLRRAAQLVAAGEPRSAILYMDLRDLRLPANDPRLVALAADAFLRDCPHLRGRRWHLLLNGADRAADCLEGIARLLDVYDVRVCLAGCGRAWTQEAERRWGRGEMSLRQEVLYPQSFSDYLAAQAGMGDPEIWLDRYLLSSGLPAVSGLQLADQTSRLQSMLRAFVSDDATRRASLADASHALRAATLLLGSCARPLSVTKASSTMRDEGLHVSRAGLSGLVDRLSEARICEPLEDFWQTREMANTRTPRAVYAGDLGLLAAFSPCGRPALADMLRNAVCLELLRRARGQELRSCRVTPGKTVDFALGNPADAEVDALIHTVDETSGRRALERAVSLLDHAMTACGCPESTLVSMSTDDTRALASGTLRIVPAHAWLAGV